VSVSPHILCQWSIPSLTILSSVFTACSCQQKSSHSFCSHPSKVMSSSAAGASLPPDISINDQPVALNGESPKPQEHRKLGRTASGGFKTTDGTIYVSKPFRSSTSKKLRAMVTFAPRQSHFDTNNVQSGMNEFRVSFHMRTGWALILIQTPRDSLHCFGCLFSSLWLEHTFAVSRPRVPS
jgi:hypothetical protein